MLFTLEIDLPVSHPVLGLRGEMEAKWLRGFCSGAHGVRR